MTSNTPTPGVEAKTGGNTPAPRRAWIWVLLAVAVLAAAALALFVWLTPTSTGTASETFEGVVEQLVIDVTGAVSLEAGERTELTITKEWLFAEEPRVVTEHANGVARLAAECPWWQVMCTTSVSGTVNADALVEVETSAGAIEVSGTTGGVDLETSAGAIRVDDVVGPARLHTSAGNITGNVTDGNVEAETSAGRIELTVLGDFSSLSAQTSAGNIDLTVSDDVYAVDADTTAGTTTIEVRTDPAATRQIFAETSAGSIKISPTS